MKHPVVALVCLLLLLTAPSGPAALAADHGRVPGPAAVVVNRAEQLLAAGKTDQAIDLLKSFKAKTQTVSPETAESRGYTHYLVDFVLGNAYLNQGQAAAAAACYQAVVERRPDFSEARFNLAGALYDLGRYAEAGGQFVAAYEADGGKNAVALYNGAVGFMQAGEHRRALPLFERLLRDHPGDLTMEWRQSLAWLYLTLDMPAPALPHLELLADQPGLDRRRQWRETLIYAYLQLDQKDKALTRVAAFTRDDPLEAKWWKIHAWLLLERQDYRRALTSLTAFGYLHDPTAPEQELLGDVNLMAGIPIEAVRHYEKNIETQAGPALFKKIAQGYLRLYDEARALTWIDKGLEQAPADADLLAVKGYLLYQADRLDEAAAVYDRLAEDSPRSGEAWLMRGYVAWRLGDFPAARRAFVRAAGYEQYAKQARQALGKLP